MRWYLGVRECLVFVAVMRRPGMCRQRGGAFYVHVENDRDETLPPRPDKDEIIDL